MNSYLISRNGRFYFRIRIPTDLQPIFGLKEIKKSLGTGNKQKALKIAHALFVHVSDTLETMKNQRPTISLVSLKSPEGFEVTADTGNDKRDLEIAKELIHTLQQTGKKNISIDTKPVPTLSQIIEEHCSEKLREGAWTPKSEQENKAIYALFLRIVGDMPLDKVNIDTARKYKTTLLQLPPSISKFGNKSIEDILSLGATPMATSTVNKNLIRVSSLFKWAVKYEYANKNSFDGLTIAKKTKASEERPPFTQADLDVLFGAEQYKKHKYLRPYYYWLPLIGLYSGMRIEEICQLHLEDIRQESEVWVFDINDTGNKKLKNMGSNRLVPIHSKLITLGLLEYAQELRNRGEERLFPELQKQRDGYSQTASKWFGRLRKKLGLAPVFHSFRHTVATTLKNKGHSQEQVAELLGHTLDSITFGRYGKAYQPDMLQVVIEGLDFDIPVQPYDT